MLIPHLMLGPHCKDQDFIDTESTSHGKILCFVTLLETWILTCQLTHYHRTLNGLVLDALRLFFFFIQSASENI